MICMTVYFLSFFFLSLFFLSLFMHLAIPTIHAAGRLFLKRSISYSYARFYATETDMEEGEEKDPLDALIDRPAPVFGFNEWKAQALELLQKSPHGPLPMQPQQELLFPWHPEFKLVRPLSQAARSTLYHTYLSDPLFFTPKRLALLFKVSVERADAIIRLKTHEMQMTQKASHSCVLFIYGCVLWDHDPYGYSLGNIHLFRVS